MKRSNSPTFAALAQTYSRAALICSALVIALICMPNPAQAQVQKLNGPPQLGGAPGQNNNVRGQQQQGPQRQRGQAGQQGQQGRGQGGQELVQRMMNKFDQDGDGKLDVSELGNFMQFVHERQQNMQRQQSAQGQNRQQQGGGQRGQAEQQQGGQRGNRTGGGPQRQNGPSLQGRGGPGGKGGGRR